MKRGFAKHWMLLGLIGGVLTAAGCGGPGYVGIYARTAPPPTRVESRGPAPGSGYIWINGIGVIAATTTHGLPAAGKGLPAGAGAGKTAAGNIVAITMCGVTAAGANWPHIKTP
jgi:hypothetical protein